MQRTPPDSQSSSHPRDGLGAKRMNAESDRKHQKRNKASSEVNEMKTATSAVSAVWDTKMTNGTSLNGLSSHGASLALDSSPARSFQSLVGAASSNGNVSEQLRDYQQALQWISMHNATKNASFAQQISVPGPHPLVHAGAVPPPNLPMPIGSVPDTSFQSMTSSPQINTASLNQARLPLGLNQNSLFQLSQYVQNGAAAMPMVIQTMEAQQLHGLTELIAANSNSMLMSPGAPGPPQSMSQPAVSIQEPAIENKQQTSQGVMKRSHGPSMDRYKNRWSETEIMNLRNGYARFGKGGTAMVEAGKNDDGQGSETSSQYRKTDSEQVWDRILRTYEFQQCRTPRDLKDKWRQLKKKEQDDMLGVREEARRLRLLSTGPNGNLSSTSNGNSNSGDNGSSTSSTHSQQGASNDQAADALDSPGPSSSSPPGGSSSGSTSSPAPLVTPSAPGAAASTPQNRSSGSPVPSRGRGGGSESGGSNEEGGSEGSGQDRDSGGADGGSEGSEGGDSTEAAVSSSGGEQGEGSGEDKTHKPAARRSAGRVPGAPVWEGGSKRKREELDQAGVPACLGLALDLGPSSVSASLVRTDGSTMEGGMGQRSVHLHPASATFNADEYLEALCGCIDDAVSFLRASQRAANKRGTGANGPAKTNGEGAHALPVPVKVVGISCFAMSLVGVSESGAAVTPVYTCADARDAAFASDLRQKLAAEGVLEQVERRTAPVQSAFAPALLLRLQQAAAADDKVHAWQTLSCFVLSQLTGRRQPVTLSEASVTGLLDRAEMQWHPVLLRTLGLAASALPPLCDADELHSQGLAEEMHERWPELAHTLWSRGIAATAAANVGSRCENPRRICVTMGSSATIRRCNATRRPARDSSKAAEGKRAAASEEEEVPHGLWCHILNQDTTLVGASLADGASMYHWAARELAGSGEEMEGMLAEAAKMEPDAHGLTILPFFSGDGSTGADAKATITGMTLRTRRAELLRGMLESVALRLKKVFTLLCAMSNDNDVEVYASGEALFKSPLWQQILADTLDVPIYLDVGGQRAAPVGAAVMALRAAGAEAQVKAVQEKCVYPRPAGVAAMRVAFERQEALYNRLHRS